MLRGIAEYDGAGVYIRQLLDALLEIDTTNQYLLGLDHLVGSRFPNRGVYLLFMTCSGATVYAVSLLLFARTFVVQQITDLKPLFLGLAKLSGAGA